MPDKLTDLAIETDELLDAMHTIARLGAKRRVAEAKLRFACALVAERLAVAIGEPCALPRNYRLVSLDPEHYMLGTAPRMKYLFFVAQRETTVNGGRRVATYVFNPIPHDAQDGFDFPQAGRLTLTQFAEDLQNGLVLEIARRIDARADKLAINIGPIEKMAKALS